MKTASLKTVKASATNKRTFNWGVKSTDISFMHITEAEAAMDGSGSGGDCSGISRFGKPRKTAPGRTNSR